jgi:hypothetical protein
MLQPAIRAQLAPSASDDRPYCKCLTTGSGAGPGGSPVSQIQTLLHFLQAGLAEDAGHYAALAIMRGSAAAGQ